MNVIVKEAEALYPCDLFTKYPVKDEESSGDPYVSIRCADPNYTVIVMSNYYAKTRADAVKKTICEVVDGAGERLNFVPKPPKYKVEITPIE